MYSQLTVVLTTENHTKYIMGGVLCVYEYIADNVIWNLPFTARNSSQVSTTAATGSPFTPKHAKHSSEMEIIELRDLPCEPRFIEHVQKDLPCEPWPTEHVQRDLPCEPRPTEHVQNEVTKASYIPELIALMNNTATDTRHEYEELKLEDFPASNKSSSLIRGEHHYDDPNILGPVVCPHGYEEPVSAVWKRLSMPSLDSISLVPGPHRLRRNSSARELAAVGSGQTGEGIRRGQQKPGKIPHYAEFSLYPTSAQNNRAISGAAISTVPHTTRPSSISTHQPKPHEYEEPSFPLANGNILLHPSRCPIPAPLKFLKRAAGDYEVPQAMTMHKVMPMQSVMQQVKLKLSSLSASVNGSFGDEETEMLIDAEHNTKEMTPDQLKSPMSTSLPSSSSSCEVVPSQETINNHVSEGILYKVAYRIIEIGWI